MRTAWQLHQGHLPPLDTIWAVAPALKKQKTAPAAAVDLPAQLDESTRRCTAVSSEATASVAAVVPASEATSWTRVEWDSEQLKARRFDAQGNSECSLPVVVESLRELRDLDMVTVHRADDTTSVMHTVLVGDLRGVKLSLPKRAEVKKEKGKRPASWH